MFSGIVLYASSIPTKRNRFLLSVVRQNNVVVFSENHAKLVGASILPDVYTNEPMHEMKLFTIWHSGAGQENEFATFAKNSKSSPKFP